MPQAQRQQNLQGVPCCSPTPESDNSFRVKLRSDMLQVVKDQHQLLQDWACQWERRSMQQMDDQFQEFTKLMSELRDELKSAQVAANGQHLNGQHLNGGLPITPIQSYQKQVAELNAMGHGVNLAATATDRTTAENFTRQTSASRADTDMMPGGFANQIAASVNNIPNQIVTNVNKSAKSIRSHIPSLDVKASPHLERLRQAEKKRNNMQIPTVRRRGVGVQSKTTSWCIDMVESNAFKALTALLIFANTLFVGVEVDQDMKLALLTPPEPMPAEFKTFNRLFAAAFTLELCTRIGAYKQRFFYGEDLLWNLFDTLLVISQFVEELLEGTNMSSIRIIRLVRLVRTLRIIRVVHFFRHLRMMVCCVFNSLMSLVWALMLLVLVMYLFAIVCVQGSVSWMRAQNWQVMPEPAAGVSIGDCVGPSDDLDEWCTRTLLEFHFQSIPRALLAMLMSIAGGVDWYEVVQPMMVISPLYAAAFSGYVVFVLFGVLNVLSAVFVDHALQIRDRDLLIHAEVAKTDAFLKDMQELFREADIFKAKKMSQEELTAYLRNERVMSYMAGHQLDVSDVDAMFKLLDVDGSGMIEESEFVLGTLRLKGQARCLDVLRLFMCFDSLTEKVTNIECALGVASYNDTPVRKASSPNMELAEWQEKRLNKLNGIGDANGDVERD